jgi:hypothetical protein
MFIHAAYHDVMLFRAPPEDAGVRRPDGPLSRAIFLDTGAGKGGALAWIDLPFEALEREAG